jgi:hypothetical protein
MALVPTYFPDAGAGSSLEVHAEGYPGPGVPGAQCPLLLLLHSVRGETQIFRQSGFRQHFAGLAQNASTCANGEIQYMLNSKSTVLGRFLKVWIQSVVHTGLKEGFVTLDKKPDFYQA